MSMEVVSRKPGPLIKSYAASSGVKKGQLCIFNSGATAIAAAHTGQTVLGVALEDADSGEVVYLKPVAGAIIKIPYYASATAQTLAATDVGTTRDINVASPSGDMTLDLDDTTGSFLVVQRYDNVKKIAYCTIPNAIIYAG